MGLNRDDVDDLLAAWALDAVDADERDAVDAVLAVDPERARVARALQHTVAALGDVVAESPPPETRMNVLRAAAARGRDSLDPTPALLLFERQVASLTELLVELDDDEWQMQVAPYAWTVHGLMAHLLVIERYMASLVGLAAPVDGDVDDHLAMGASVIAAEVAGSFRRTFAAWKAQVTDTIAAIRSRPEALDDQVVFHGWPVSVATLLVVRAFEVWTHADDIRRATGRAVADTTATRPAGDVDVLGFDTATARAVRAREGSRPHRAHGSRRRHVRSRRAGLRTYGDAGCRRRRLLPHRGTSHRHRRAAGGHRGRPRPRRGAAHRGPRARRVIRHATRDERASNQAQPPHRGDHFDG